MEVVPAGGRCRACGSDGPLPEFPLQCQACGGFDVEVLRGEELLVEALEIEDDVLIANGGMGCGD
jgi:hydrogenase nickel incorporation protein HypA/HybF